MTANATGQSRIETATNARLETWGREAQISFAKHGASGGTFRREVWANGQTMVAWNGVGIFERRPSRNRNGNL